MAPRGVLFLMSEVPLYMVAVLAVIRVSAWKSYLIVAQQAYTFLCTPRPKLTNSSHLAKLDEVDARVVVHFNIGASRRIAETRQTELPSAVTPGHVNFALSRQLLPN